MATQAYISAKVLIGESAAVKQITRQVLQLARAEWPVLILGETGTGKEICARAIHNASLVGARSIAPFVPIDCSVLGGPLMETELFGHAKGSFTGAFTQKIGLIEAANGGTAFFDEIGELPLSMQAKLLRVLQEKEFRPVGAISTQQSNFRIIAATNRDLKREVEAGTFRRDLYYRLNVTTLFVPPLRDRPEDIPLLANHFISRCSRSAEIAADALNVLMSYSWPGNVRELENCIHRVLATNDSSMIFASALPEELKHHRIETACDRSARMLGEEIRSENVVAISEAEDRAIQHAMAFTKGDRGAAAALLGIGRTTLYRKLKKRPRFADVLVNSERPRVAN